MNYRLSFVVSRILVVVGAGLLSMAQAATSPEIAQRLAALEKGFQEAAEREAEAQYKVAVISMNEGYAAALERALNVAIQGGKTNDALALRAEKQRIEKGEEVPSEEMEGNAETPPPEALKALRKTYRASREQHEAMRMQKLRPLFDKYQQALMAVAADLTKAGDLDEALRVKTMADDLVKSRATGARGAPVTAGGSKTKVSVMMRSFTNSLGMKFVPVPGTKVLFCIHETRRKDYAAYAAANKGVNDIWKKPVRDGVAIGTGSEDEPVGGVTWTEAKDFCDWLGRQEGHTYRMATDREWSTAVGIASREAADATPQSLAGKLRDVYPWGNKWPPPKGSGNYQDEAYKTKFPDAKSSVGYNDGFATCSPVMSFKPNPFGLYDMAGNVWEMCEDWADTDQKNRVSRGGSWSTVNLASSSRNSQHPLLRAVDRGFRCVVEPDK